MLVREVMSAPVATVPTDATLREAAGRMVERGVGSLVAVEADGPERTPTGILTDTDVLRVGARGDRALQDVAVADVASTPLITVEPDRTVGNAVDRMVAEGVTHLAVVDGLDVVGMVTLTDVALEYDEIRDETASLVGRRGDWDAEE